MRQHTSSVGKAVAEHATQVAAVADQVRSITAAAREIERLNAAARVLSINARIEASRSSGSSVFSTIADRDAAPVQGDREREQDGLRARQRDGEGGARAACGRTSTLARSSRATPSRPANGSTSSIAASPSCAVAVGTTLAESDNALAEIVAESHAALSKLQFQDVCAQGLLQIDGWVAELSQQTAADLGVESDIAPVAHATVGNDDVEVDRAEAGEVMLF